MKPAKLREQKTIRLPAELIEQLQREADRAGYSFNTEVIILLRSALEAEQDRVPFRKQKYKPA